MQTDLPQARTTGAIAAALGVPAYRVEYVLRTRPHIRPYCVAGNVRLFDAQGMAKIRHALTAIDARRADR